MNKITQTCAEFSAGHKTKKSKRPALMTHVVLGYPSLKESIDIVRTMADAGASFIELQIPFSDPIADGPTIMGANQIALEQGLTPSDCFKAANLLAKKVNVPLLFMTYFNLVLQHKGSVRGFCRDAQDSGIQGLIVPDVPLTHNVEHYWDLALEHNLSPIPIASPTSSPERLSTIEKYARQGFVYCVSTTATTGAKKELPKDLHEYLRRVQRFINAPKAVGFGISTPEHVKSLSGVADIAVVGSATIDLVKRTPKAKRLKAVAEFTAALAGLR